MRYNTIQVMSAATFLWKNNPNTTMWPSKPTSVGDVMKYIIEFAETQGGENMSAPDAEWVPYAGIGGFMVIFSSDQPDVLDIEVYVNPSVGSEGVYVYSNNCE